MAPNQRLGFFPGWSQNGAMGMEWIMGKEKKAVAIQTVHDGQGENKFAKDFTLDLNMSARLSLRPSAVWASTSLFISLAPLGWVGPASSITVLSPWKSVLPVLNCRIGDTLAAKRTSEAGSMPT
jgi:hypothetical protein